MQVHHVALPWISLAHRSLGLTRRRAEAEKRQGTDHHHYIFDLDVREDENDDEDEDAQKFSVDSHAHGNWTRFVKCVTITPLRGRGAVFADRALCLHPPIYYTA